MSILSSIVYVQTRSRSHGPGDNKTVGGIDTHGESILKLLERVISKRVLRRLMQEVGSAERDGESRSRKVISHKETLYRCVNYRSLLLLKSLYLNSYLQVFNFNLRTIPVDMHARASVCTYIKRETVHSLGCSPSATQIYPYRLPKFNSALPRIVIKFLINMSNVCTP